MINFNLLPIRDIKVGETVKIPILIKDGIFIKETYFIRKVLKVDDGNVIIVRSYEDEKKFHQFSPQQYFINH
jgi:hypothetical protein